MKKWSALSFVLVLVATGFAAETENRHPLDPLTKNELAAAVQLLRADARVPSAAFFPVVVLNEPPKGEVLAFTPGSTYRREAYVEVYDRPHNALSRAIVDLRSRQVLSLILQPPGTQPTTFLDEYSSILPVVRENADWIDAMRRRGLNPDDVYLDVWAGGDLPIPTASDGTAVPAGTRIMRVLSFFQGDLPNPYDRPIEGVVVAVDMNRLKVLQVLDTGIRPISMTSGNAENERNPLPPLREPSGAKPGYQIIGHEVRWQNWRFRYALHPRDGLVLYLVGYQQPEGRRSIAYRMSLSEIYVPYGLPDINWVWRTAFDEGEYGLGRYANPLLPDIDAPADATFLNVRLADDVGGSILYPRAVAIFEQEAGMLWKRVDPTTVQQDARGSRQLVVTANSWIGNYIYGLTYTFRQDGSLDVRIDLAGTTLNRGVQSAAEAEEFGTLVGENVAAPNHQHFFSFRLDLDIDGTANSVVEANVTNAPSEFGNAFKAVETLLANETEARRDAGPGTARSWKVKSGSGTNKLGQATGYSLRSSDPVLPYSTAEFGARQRAGFVEHQLWVTAYQPDEFYATGPFPNQGRAGEGLPEYSNGQSLMNQDVVLWYTLGVTHVPEVEDYPVMPTASVGFRLTPSGFFSRNPALNVPRPLTRR